MTFDDLTLLPEPAVRAALGGTHRLRLCVLRPPYPAAGVGALRALRFKETAGTLDVTAGYENYRRLDA